GLSSRRASAGPGPGGSWHSDPLVLVGAAGVLLGRGLGGPAPLGSGVVGGSEARQLQLDARAALARLTGLHRSPMSVRYRPHDREPQAGAAGGPVAGGVGAMEAMEYALSLVE